MRYVEPPITAIPEKDLALLVDREGKTILHGRIQQLSQAKELERIVNTFYKMKAAVETQDVEDRHLATCPECQKAEGACLRWKKLHRIALGKHFVAMQAIREMEGRGG